MRLSALSAAALLLAQPLVGPAQDAPKPSIPAPSAPPTADPVLASLLQEALERNPDLARGRDLAEAEKERVPQARALPDPTLSLGLQNDGFKRIEVGRMETSFYQVMATQPLPWPGKRAARGELASLDVEGRRIELARARRTLVADVQRAYFGLLLARDQLALLGEQEQLLAEAETITRTRYEVGQGAQADLLRAQLERTRLRQARIAQETGERSLLAELNHLRHRDPDAPLATSVPLASVPDPALEDPEPLRARAAAESPELQGAKLGLRQAEKSLELARLDRRPDFAVTAGLMPRGGLDPMWQVGFSIGLPIFSGRKQQRAVAQQEWRRRAEGSQVAFLGHMLQQRVDLRRDQLASALQVRRLYREGLLVQSEAAFRAVLAQYEAGRSPFLAVLEALNGWIADRAGALQAQAQVLALGIAQEELALGPTQPLPGTPLAAPALAMGGGSSPAVAAAAKANPSSPAADGGAMKSM